MILEIAKQNDKEVDARDGSAWSIVQYEKGDIVWERKPDYIYGIEPLEAILEIAKQNDKEVDARDGSAWSIVQYEKGDIVWERKPDYIYGIEPLEAIANILISLKNK